MEKQSAHGDVDYRFGNIEARFAIAHEAPPSRHPAEGALDDLAPRQDLEVGLTLDASNDFDHEVEIGGLAHQVAPVIGTVGEQVLDPGPALADRGQDHLDARAVGDTRWRQIDHEQPAIGVDRDVTVASDDLLGTIQAALGLGCRCPFGLAVENAG